MTQLLGLVFQLSWWLGLLTMIAGVVVKLLRYEQRVTVKGSTLFLIAGTLFLCTIATRQMQKARASQ